MIKKFSPPLSRPSIPPIPHQQKDGIRKDGTPRLGKWVVSTPEGLYRASEYFWWYNTNHLVPKYKMAIFLDRTSPLDTSRSNMRLVSTRERNTLISRSRACYVYNNKRLQSRSLNEVRASIALYIVMKEVNKYDKE